LLHLGVYDHLLGRFVHRDDPYELIERSARRGSPFAAATV
jgi:hypothetical protein